MKNFRIFLRLVGISFTLVLWSACSTTPTQKPEAEKASDLAVKEYREADLLYKNKKGILALKKLASIAQKNPRTDVANDSLYLMGQIYYEQGDYLRAARYWQAVVESPVASNRADRATVNGSIALTQVGHFDDALNLLKKIQITETTDKNLAAQAMELSAKLKLLKSDASGALQDLMTARTYRQTPGEKQALYNRALEIINGNLSTKQLDDLQSSSKFEELDLPIRYRLATSLFEQKSWSQARSLFLNIIEKYPGTDQAKHAQNYVSNIEAQERTDSNVVGVVLPLTGKYSQMGYKTLRGVQLGLGIFNHTNPTAVKLAIIDSEGNPDVARRGVERLVSEDHAVAIIGDLLSKTAQAVAVKAQELGVPCLALSQKQGLTDIGDFVFRNTLTSDMQMRSLVDVAMKERGYKKFAIIYPNESYGTEYASAFWDYVLMNGGQVTAAQSYQPEETDFRNAIERIVGTFYAEEDRGKELQLRMTAWQKDQKAKSLHDKLPKDILPPIVDFDALFIPDSPKAVGQIAPMLAYNDVDKLPLMGTNLWDTPQIIERGGKFVDKALFVDNFFADDQSPSMKHFLTDFQSQFGYKPDVFEAQGYDSAVLINQVLKSYNYNISRSGLRDRLSTVSNVQGSTGILKMSPQKEVEKSLIPLTVTNGQIVKLDTKVGAPQ